MGQPLVGLKVVEYAPEVGRSGLQPRVRRAPPSLLSCGLLLFLFDFHLRTAGLRRSLRLSEWLGGARPTAQRDEALVVQTVRRVAEAAAFYPGRAECLEQSLALAVLLRRRGIPAQLRLGVRPYPFMAHAWVEYDGRPINEREELVGTLAPFPSLGG